MFIAYYKKFVSFLWIGWVKEPLRKYEKEKHSHTHFDGLKSTFSLDYSNVALYAVFSLCSCVQV